MVELESAPPRKSIIFKNLTILYAAQLVTGILSLVPITFLPRYLGGVGMGKLTLAISFAGIFSALILMGTAVYVVREIARDQQCLAEIVSSSVILRAGLALVLLPIAAGLLYVLGYPSDTRTVVLIMYGAIAIRMIGNTFSSALAALHNMTWRSAVVVMGETVAVGTGWLILRQGGSVIDYVLVLVLAYTVELLVGLAYFVIVLPIRPVIRAHAIQATFWGGIPFFLWALLQTIYQQTSSLMLSKLGGEEAVGWFGTANQFIIPLFMLPSVAITVLLPQFSQLHVLEPAALRRAIARSMSYMTIITVPLAFGLAIVAKQVIDLFDYPATFQHSVPVLQLLAFSLPAGALLMVAATAVAAMNKERAWAKVSLFSVATAILFNAALIPSAQYYVGNAATGAAGAALLAELLTLALVMRLVGQAMLDGLIFITLGKTMLAGALMSAIVLGMSSAPLPVVIAVGGLVYISAILVLNVLPSEDFQTIHRMVASRGLIAAAMIRNFTRRGK